MGDIIPYNIGDIVKIDINQETLQCDYNERTRNILAMSTFKIIKVSDKSAHIFKYDCINIENQSRKLFYHHELIVIQPNYIEF